MMGRDTEFVWHVNGTWEPAPTPPTPNFCSECGAKLGENPTMYFGKPIHLKAARGDGKSRLSMKHFLDAYFGITLHPWQQEAIDSLHKAEAAASVKYGMPGIGKTPTVLLCHPANIEAAKELMKEKPVNACPIGNGPYSCVNMWELLREEPKPEPVGNFRHGDAVILAVDEKKEVRCEVRRDGAMTLWSADFACEGMVGTRFGFDHLRHVHKTDDGRTCNCSTCNPCGKADDLDCTCEKCCPRTLDGLVDLFGADVVRSRLLDMTAWSTVRPAKWLYWIGIAGVQWQVQGTTENSNYRIWSEATPWTLYKRDTDRVHRINPDFYQSEAWRKLSETPCVFDGKSWTPKTKGAE